MGIHINAFAASIRRDKKKSKEIREKQFANDKEYYNEQKKNLEIP